MPLLVELWLSSARLFYKHAAPPALRALPIFLGKFASFALLDNFAPSAD